MPAPDPCIVLDVWERGLRQPLQRQAVALLAAVTPGTSEAEIAALPLGVRDAMLLDLRETLFGPDLAAVAACPRCGAQLEAAFAVDAVRSLPAAPADAARTLETPGHAVAFRPPCAADLLAIPAGADTEAARAVLLDRCVTAVDGEGARVAPAALPPALSQAIAECMAAADPMAVIELQLDCAACRHGFLAIFDIARFLMREIHHWARQMLRDIDCLARTYGWREADILALSPVRRQIYLEMAVQ
jgi:hypothetical protein